MKQFPAGPKLLTWVYDVLFNSTHQFSDRRDNSIRRLRRTPVDKGRNAIGLERISYHFQIIVHKDLGEVPGRPKVDQVDAVRLLVVQEVAPVRVRLRARTER